jgi:GTP cyclohydrolase I
MRLNGNSVKKEVVPNITELNNHLRIIGDKPELQEIDLASEPDSNALDEKSKIQLIERHFSEIMSIMGLDLSDDSLKDTPHRVAKMFVKEVFSGLNPENKPKVKLFKNKFNYNQMLIEKDIKLNSYCEHHFVPIIGKVHVAYISNGHVIGLSKINRIVEYYAKRPQLQERLTQQIADELKNVLNTEDVAVVIEATHMCVTIR